MTTKITKAIFPVAGLGTRFLPATKALPKEMLPVVDKPLIQYAVEEAYAAGIREMIFVNGRNKRAIPDHFDTAYELETEMEAAGKTELLEMVRNVVPPHVRTIFVTQPEALGLGHAVLCAQPVVGDEPFAVILPDDLIWNRNGRGALGQMVDHVHAHGGSAIAVENVSADKTGSYGIVDVEQFDHQVGRIRSIVEKPRPEEAPSTLAVVGRYVLEPRIFEHLHNTRPGAGGEIQLTDAIARLLQDSPVNAYKFSGTRFDCGSHLGFVEATIRFALDNEKLSDSAAAAMQKALDELAASAH